MHARDWLEAHRAGKVVHDFVWITLHHPDGREMRIQVSADAPRVIDQRGDRHRRSAGAYACQQLAEALGGYMPTPKILDERHLQATVILQPLVSSLIKPGGTITNTTDIEHSEAIDRAIQRAVPFTSWGAAPYQAKAGDWCVSSLGKQFALNGEEDERHAMNYGAFVHIAETTVKNGRRYWRGVPVHRADWALDKLCVIQPSATAHGFGPTDRDQDDYFQLPLIVGPQGRVDGETVPTSVIYTDERLAGFVTHDGKPLAWSRQPGVPSIERIAAPPLSEPPPPEDAIDPEAPRGEQLLQWMRSHLGHAEVPKGSNKSPLIELWLSRCARSKDGKPIEGFGAYLAARGANWCTAFACAGLRAIGVSDRPDLQMFVDEPRCSGFEMEEDAKAIGTYVPIGAYLAGERELVAGDLLLLPRGEPGSWQRHMTAYDRPATPKGFVIGLGGNQDDSVSYKTYRLEDVVGVIPVTTPPAAKVKPKRVEPPVDLAAADPADDGNNLLARAGWDGIEDAVAGGPAWRPDRFHRARGATRAWRVTDEGILVRGETGVRRTKGQPVTLGKIKERYEQLINEFAVRYDITRQLLAATIATEAGLDEKAERYEKKLNDWSIGLMQTLTSTAHALGKRTAHQLPAKPVPRGGDVDAWRKALGAARVSIELGAMYLADNDKRFGLCEDPVLAYAAYNGGSPQLRPAKPWGLLYFTYDADKDGRPEYDAIDTFAAWYGDACAVF